jgi:hypothetical protein
VPEDDGVELSEAEVAAIAAEAAAPTRDPKPKRRPGARKARKPEPGGAEKARKRRAREASDGVSRETPAAETPPPPGAIKALERGLARTLTMPAIPTAILPLPIDSKLFMLQHFTTAGPATAKQLAAAAEGSPELREVLERANKGSAALTLLMAGCIYLAPVVLWVLGQRETAAMASMLASADPDELQAQAEQMQAQMAEAMMAAANGSAAQQQGAPSPEHEGPTDSDAQAEQAQAG